VSDQSDQVGDPLAAPPFREGFPLLARSENGASMLSATGGAVFVGAVPLFLPLPFPLPLDLPFGGGLDAFARFEGL